MLKNRVEMYSPKIYWRLKRAVFRAFRFGVLWFGMLGSLLAFLIGQMAHGEDLSGPASWITALLLFSLLPAYGRLRDLFITPPNLIAYFSAQVPGFDLTGGVELLRQSRSLDSLAWTSGLKSIGAFVSDDDLFDKSGPTWHSARDGLATFDGLLQRHGSHPSVLAAKQDLIRIRDRLQLAESSNIKFCLLLRDVHVTNAMEWEQRKGHA